MVPKTLVHMLIEQTPIAYIIMDDQYRIHYANESFLKLRNLSKDATIGEKCYNISNGGEMCRYCAIERALRTGEKELIQRKDILPDGSVRYIDDYAIPLFRDADTGRMYLLEIMVNRSEEFSARKQYNNDVEEVVSSLVELLEAKDRYTAFHSKNVHNYATCIAQHMGLSEEDTFRISLAALLHDIGKVQIPLDILNKPGKLNNEEFHIIQSHPEVASKMLDGLICLKDISEMVRHHHERVDGHGYPDGISGDQLSIGSRILAVADTYDAMTTDRPYRKALSRKTAIEELNRVKDTQLDRDVVQAFEEIPEFEFLEEKQLSNDETLKCVQPLLVRQLPQESICDVRTDLVVELKELENQINDERMQSAIFEQTPCGYVVLDNKDTLVYANSFFLELIGADANNVFGRTFTLFYSQQDDEVQELCTRMMRDTPVGIRTFDLYPMVVESSEYKLFTVIDRTKEAEMTMQLNHELQYLLKLLEQILFDEKEKYGLDFCSPEEINSIKRRIEELLNQQKQIRITEGNQTEI